MSNRSIRDRRARMSSLPWADAYPGRRRYARSDSRDPRLPRLAPESAARFAGEPQRAGRLHLRDLIRPPGRGGRSVFGVPGGGCLPCLGALRSSHIIELPDPD